MGPIIFLLFINDLPSFLKDVHIVMYADDTTIAVAAETADDLEQLTVDAVNTFTRWCERNRLIVNLEKTVCVNFHQRRPSNITIGNSIKNNETVKFLGIILNHNLTFEDQIHLVSKKLNSAFYALLQLRGAVDESGIVTAYYALVYAVLSYNVLVWGRGRDWIRVFTAQKRIVRLIFGLHALDSCRSYFRYKKLLSFPSIFIYKALCFVRINLQRFAVPQHEHRTRNKELLLLAQHTSSLFERSPSYCFAKIYNKLPNAIKDLRDLNSFKRQTKEFLIERAHYSLQEYFET